MRIPLKYDQTYKITERIIIRNLNTSFLNVVLLIVTNTGGTQTQDRVALARKEVCIVEEDLAGEQTGGDDEKTGAQGEQRQESGERGREATPTPTHTHTQTKQRP